MHRKRDSATRGQREEAAMGGSGYKIGGILGGIFGLAALLISVVALNASSDDGGSKNAESAAPQTIEVELGDFYIKPPNLTVASGTEVTLKVHNAGAIDHDLSVEGGPKTPLIPSGETVALSLGAVDGAKSLLCSVPGHKEAGMAAALTIGAAGGHAPEAVATAMSHEEMDKSYMAGVKAYPAATKGQGNQPLAPKVVDGVKVFELTAAEIDWEVAPGEVKKGMAYNGMIPGPAIHAALGDRVRIVLHNQLKESTAIHFHGVLVPNSQDGVPGITQPLVQPGETYTYEFVVRNAGSHMYHSHMNATAQVTAGLLGAFIIDGPAEPRAAHDEIMVLNDGPLGYTINGKGFPATQPLVAKQGEVIRVRYMNEGLQIHPMHLHGMTQTVIALDGNPVPQPYLQDTILVAPGQRVDVLVTASEVGTWAFHCHVLSHAENEQGMFGMVTALVVQ